MFLNIACRKEDLKALESCFVLLTAVVPSIRSWDFVAMVRVLMIDMVENDMMTPACLRHLMLL